MKKPNELPEKKAPPTDDPNTKKSSPTAPVIETPEPPQVMDPSAPPPDIEKRKPSIPPGKRKKVN